MSADFIAQEPDECEHGVPTCADCIECMKRRHADEVRALNDENDALQAEVCRLEASDAANERRWRNEEAAKQQIMGYRDEERARADALQARLDTLTAPAEGVDIAEVLRLDQEATSGPWSSDENEDCWRLHGSGLAPGCVQILKAPKRGTPYSEYWPRAADALLIATYRTAAPALAREVARLRAALATAERERDGLRLALADAEAAIVGPDADPWRSVFDVQITFKGPIGDYAANCRRRVRDVFARVRAALATAEQERDAYKRAKAENDERFQNERDMARAECDALRDATATYSGGLVSLLGLAGPHTGISVQSAALTHLRAIIEEVAALTGTVPATPLDGVQQVCRLLAGGKPAPIARQLGERERECRELRLALAAEQDLLRRAFQTIHVGRRRAPLWVHVREVFMHGSGVSQDLCRRLNYDPDQEVGGTKRAARRTP